MRTMRTGEREEERACRLLKSEGYEVIVRNWRCRFGEIDIVAREGPILAFVEVKARSHEGFGGPEGAVNPAKQRRLIAAARAFLMDTKCELRTRFDVVALVGESVRLYRDAFRVG
jgi:putative endonuclease